MRACLYAVLGRLDFVLRYAYTGLLCMACHLRLTVMQWWHLIATNATGQIQVLWPRAPAAELHDQMHCKRHLRSCIQWIHNKPWSAVPFLPQEAGALLEAKMPKLELCTGGASAGPHHGVSDCSGHEPGPDHRDWAPSSARCRQWLCILCHACSPGAEWPITTFPCNSILEMQD